MDVKSILTESSQFLAPISRFEITINIGQEDLTHKRKDTCIDNPCAYYTSTDGARLCTRTTRTSS